MSRLSPTTALSFFAPRYLLASLLVIVLGNFPFTVALSQEVAANQLLRQMIANGGAECPETAN